MRCATCRYYRAAEEKYYSGGFCHWRPPMVLRGVTWGADNPRIPKPDEEYCSEHSLQPSI